MVIEIYVLYVLPDLSFELPISSRIVSVSVDGLGKLGRGGRGLNCYQEMLFRVNLLLKSVSISACENFCCQVQPDKNHPQREFIIYFSLAE